MFLLRNVDYFTFAYAWNAERFAVAWVLLHFVTLPALSRISETSEQNLILQSIEQLIQYKALEIQFQSWK